MATESPATIEQMDDPACLVAGHNVAESGNRESEIAELKRDLLSLEVELGSVVHIEGLPSHTTGFYLKEAASYHGEALWAEVDDEGSGSGRVAFTKAGAANHAVKQLKTHSLLGMPAKAYMMEIP